MSEQIVIQTIIPPKEGWCGTCMYLVNISYAENNPIHKALFYSGFLNGPGKTPGGYNSVISFIEGTNTPLQKVRYLKVIKLIATQRELTNETWELPKEAELKDEI